MDQTDERPGFLPRTEVANLVGVSKSTITRWVEQGDIRGEQRESGAWFVHLEDAEQRRALGANFKPPEDDELTATKDPASQLLLHASKHFAQMGKYIDTLHGPAERLLGLLANENERLRDRCKSLEDRHVDNLTLYEKMVSEQHDRQLAEQEAVASQMRKTEAWKTLLHYAPTVASMVANHAGGAAVSAPLEEGALRQMVLQLPPEQIKQLATQLPPHMSALLMQIHKHQARNNGSQEKEARSEASGNGQAA